MWKKRFHMRSNQEEPEISRCVMQILPRQQECLAGRLKKGLDEMCADTWRWQSQNQTDMKIEIFNKLEIQFICRAVFSQAALFLLPCIRKELPVAGPVDIKVCKRSCFGGRFGRYQIEIHIF